ncbi:hypothetical protein, conserved [Plasmodium gonderi]|uniref:General stress protein FMN-binding split barrel domain-containing protein n=1 Tax=Plasmodium gonderi TaxID=77519 RepID=A0A1Y1JNJ5_PLAGO|nr:hypothetical protein, conserved [Plasmodium gonderi]GAW83830.1 hypothetical protein, conserved [Plasmodium gonderi]
MNINVHKRFIIKCREAHRGARGLHEMEIIRKKNFMGKICLMANGGKINGLTKIQKRYLFFRNEKNDIIKNEIEEILKMEQDPTMMKRREENFLNENDLDERWAKREKYDEQGERREEKQKKEYKNKRGKFKRLFIFITFQSIPIVGIMYLFKYVESVKLAELNFSFDSSEDIIKEALKLIQGNSKCFCVYSENNEIKTFFIDPLDPENCEVNYETGEVDEEKKQIMSCKFDQLSNELKKTEKAPEEDDEVTKMRYTQSSNGSKEIIPKREKTGNSDDITKLLYSMNRPLMHKIMNLKSSTELPLNYLYFCISKNTDIHNFLKKKNEYISLLYSDDTKNIYVTLAGNASIIESDIVRNIFWTNKWSYLIPDDYRDNYVLVKFTPSIVSLKTIGLKNQHWKSNIVRRSIINDKLAWVKI